MSNATSRHHIFSRLYAAPRGTTNCLLDDRRMAVHKPYGRGKIHRLKQLMEEMRTEVHVVSGGPWIEEFVKILLKKGLENLLYSPRTEVGAVIEKRWKESDIEDEKLPALIPYTENIEDFKARLFEVEAAITTSKGAIVETGAIILWPDEREPRTMSLVPSIHFVVLDAETIYSDLSEAMDKQNWNDKIPTNALLISGPSKTADIELTLAFGVHGPKELVVLIQAGEQK